MTRRDAVQFVMGYIVGVSQAETKSRSANPRGLVTRALRRGVRTIMTRQAGFFNALERIVEEELRDADFEGDPN